MAESAPQNKSAQGPEHPDLLGEAFLGVEGLVQACMSRGELGCGIEMGKCMVFAGSKGVDKNPNIKAGPEVPAKRRAAGNVSLS